jgi:hypothetical protein
MERGDPISYLVLAEKTPVETADGERVGEVHRVLADDATAIFDGLILDTPDGERFVDAPHVQSLYERLVVLDLTAEQARRLPDPTASPGVIDYEPDDEDESDVESAIRRAWDRISGRS